MCSEAADVGGMQTAPPPKNNRSEPETLTMRCGGRGSRWSRKAENTDVGPLGPELA